MMKLLLGTAFYFSICDALCEKGPQVGKRYFAVEPNNRIWIENINFIILLYFERTYFQELVLKISAQSIASFIYKLSIKERASTLRGKGPQVGNHSCIRSFDLIFFL